MSSDENNFGLALRRKRKEMGLSQAEFARRMGVHRRTQINYESGKRLPSLAYLRAVEGAGIEIAELTGTREALHHLRAAAYLNLLGKTVLLLGVSAEGLGYALDQAMKIVLESVVTQGSELILDDEKVNREMVKLATRLLHEAGVDGF